MSAYLTRRDLLRAAAAVGLAACAPSPGPAAASPARSPAGAAGPTLTSPVNLRLASQEVGGGWYVYGAAVADVLHPRLPAGSTVDVLPHAAAIGNPKNIAAGQAEFGFGLAVPTRWAFDGAIAFDKKLDNLRALVGGLDNYYLGIVVRKSLGIGSLEEIRERKLPVRMFTVPRGGVGEFANRQILQALGLSYEAVQQQGGTVQHVGFNVITSAFREGRADLLMHTVNLGHPAMTEIATTADVEFLPLPDGVVRELAKVGWPPVEMPARFFPKQERALRTVGDFTILMAGTSLPDDVAYVITRTVVENKDALARANAALRAFEPEVAWQKERTAIPLHAGAERYYRDRGWLR